MKNHLGTEKQYALRQSRIHKTHWKLCKRTTPIKKKPQSLQTVFYYSLTFFFQYKDAKLNN